MLGEEVFTVKEVATLLKVGEKTVYSMAQAGELPAFKVTSDLLPFLVSRRDRVLG